MVSIYNNNNLPKKYIKRLFHHPERAYCKMCTSKMFMLPTEETYDKIMFRCVSSICGKVIDVTEYKSKYTLNLKRLNKNVVPFKNTNAISVSLMLTLPRIKDKYYTIDEKIKYNPVSKMKEDDGLHIVVNEKQHEELVNIIKDNLLNGQS